MDDLQTDRAAGEDEQPVRADAPVAAGSLLGGAVFPLALALLLPSPGGWRDLLDPQLCLFPLISAGAGWVLYRLVNGLLRALGVRRGVREHLAWCLVWIGGPLALFWRLAIEDPSSPQMGRFLLALVVSAMVGGVVGHRLLTARLRQRTNQRSARTTTAKAVDPALEALLSTARRDLAELEAFERHESAAAVGVDGAALLAHGRQSLTEMERLAERLSALRTALTLEVQDERLRDRASRSMERLLELSDALAEASEAVRGYIAGGRALGGLGRQAERLSRMVDSQDELEDELEARVSRT